MMAAATSSGFESIATWLVGSSTVVAFIFFANTRSSAAGIMWSLVPTMYVTGFVCQAAFVTLSSSAFAWIGPCVAAITSVTDAGRS